MAEHDKKPFDAVAMMRAIRDELNRELAGMTLDEELRWLRETKLGDPQLERLAETARTKATRSTHEPRR